MDKLDFMPVILGTDVNAYGMARAFHEAYGIKSTVVGKAALFTTMDSCVCDVLIYDDFATESGFLQRLLSLGQSLKGNYKKLLLVSSSDGYVEQIVKVKKTLSAYYELPFVSEDLMNQLIEKEAFYKMCDAYGIDYPKTAYLSGDTSELTQMPFAFPVVLKPSDSMRYFETQFEGKKKAYILEDLKTLNEALYKIRAAGYRGTMIMQEYIPGDDSAMRVLNAYSSLAGKVQLMSLGQPLLEDPTPTMVGNYVAIMDAYDESLFEKIKGFLEGMGYVGFSNFDMKYDARTKTYKVFEINLRQGRSSYFTTGSGYNLAKALVEDLVEGREQKTVFAKAEHLWLGMSKGVLLKYLSSEALKEAVKKRINEGKVSHTLWYGPDKKLKRSVHIWRYYHGFYKKFKAHFVPKK